MDPTNTPSRQALRPVTTLSGVMKQPDGTSRAVTLRVHEGSGERVRVRRTFQLEGDGPSASELVIEDRG